MCCGRRALWKDFACDATADDSCAYSSRRASSPMERSALAFLYRMLSNSVLFISTLSSSVIGKVIVINYFRIFIVKIKYLIFSFLVLMSRQSAALGSATQHAMPPEYCGKCVKLFFFIILNVLNLIHIT